MSKTTGGRWAGAGLLLLAACQGGGSDIGPRLQPLPEAKFKLQVLDEQGRGVAGAKVTVAGVAPAATGRSGRADLFQAPHGQLLVEVDGSAGSAVASDRLPVLTFVADFAGGAAQLPYPVHLPDTAPSAGLPLTAGVQAGSAALDDTATSGALLQIAAGATVTAGAAPALVVRSGGLGAGHLPGVLPIAGSGTYLFSRGCFVDPPQLAIAPGATLELPNDLQLPNGAAAELYWLDVATGIWTLQGPAVVVNGGQQLRSNAGVGHGGLYAFAVPVTQTAAVTGRVVDGRGREVGQALVQAGDVRVQAGGNGRFRLDGIAAVLGDGSPRSVTVEARGGLFHYPSGAAVDLVLPAAGVVDVGDVTLATDPVGNIRIQLVENGRAYARERFALSSLDGAMAAVTLFDDQGHAIVEEVPAGYFGFTLGHPSASSTEKLFEAQAVGFLDEGKLWYDTGAFLGESFWFTGSRSTRAQALDRRGGGPLRDVAVIRGDVPGDGFLQYTREGGVVVNDRHFSGRATAAVHSSEAGVEITSAVTFVEPYAEHLEMPMRRALRADVGAFDRHGLVRGQLTLATMGTDHRLRSTRRLSPSDWFDAAMFAEPIASSLPIKLDPATSGLDFAAGVAVPGGQLVAVEGSTGGNGFTLTKVGALLGLSVPEAEVTALDLPLQYDASASFGAPGAAQGLDAGFAAADLAFDLALLLPDGTAADVARGIAGNHAVSGADVTFTLPALTGGLQGGDWLCAIGAERSVGSGSVAQRSVQQFGVHPLSVPFLPVPDILAPADQATVPADGFRVDYTVPAGTNYLQLELRSDGPAVTLHWLVVLPPDRTSFEFVRLPTQAATPLLAGRSYQLTLTACRIDTGPLLQRSLPYIDATSYWMSIDAYKRGVRALASRTITITTN